MTTLRQKTGRTSETAHIDADKIRDIRKLIISGEGLRLEFKAKANHPDKIARSLCSLCNGSGGTLLLGVGDDRTISGVRYPDEDIHAIIKILKTARPFVKFRFFIIPVSNKRSVVRFDVMEAKRKPVSLRMDKGKVFVRSADQSLQAGPVMKAVLKLQTSKEGPIIRFGEEEKLILDILKNGNKKAFRQLSQSLELSSADMLYKLSVLVSAGVLRLIPGEQEESFVLNIG